MLKGIFFHSLATKWQRKLGAPKPNETFEELYSRARTLECHDQQFTQSAAGKNEPRTKKTDRSASEPTGQSRANKPKNTSTELTGRDKTGQINVLIAEDIVILLSTVGNPRGAVRLLGGVINPILC